MMERPAGTCYVAWWAAATLLLAASSGRAQQAAATGTAGAGHASAARTGGAPAGGHTSAPSRTGIAGRSGTHGQGQVHANNAATVQDPGAPRPTWELPRTVTPHWEIPNYNPVDPNPVAGNPRRHDSVGVGGFVGYGAVPGYSFIEPDAADQQTLQPGQDAGPQEQGQYGPQYEPQFAPGQDPGPAGYPPGYPYAAPADPAGSRRAPYRPDLPARAAAPSQSTAELTDGLEHPEVTLLFHDGRPPLKVHSYAVTGSALLAVENGRQTRISLSDLDLPATEERNRANGVDFSIPGSR